MVGGIKDYNKNIAERTFDFSLRIIKLYLYIQKEHGELRILSNQLIKSGTSIGANIEEAQGAQSKADFLAKYHIALKEARETHYWLRLLAATKIIPRKRLENILSECEEITRILGASLVTGKGKTR